MAELGRIDPGFPLDPLAHVVELVVRCAPGLDPDHIMVVGAWARDILHEAGGHDFRARATHDLDLALALSEWRSFEAFANHFPRVGDSGVGFRIGDVIVDVIPFGSVEDPRGSASPPTRDTPISVWGFAEIYAKAVPLDLGHSLIIRCPSVPGYTAAKLAAWLDRSTWHEVKDAGDLALAVYWCAQSSSTEARLYDTIEGQSVLVAEDLDVPCAAAHLLGRDVGSLIGHDLRTELLARWPGDMDLLIRNFVVPTTGRWPREEVRRVELVEALIRGIRFAHAP